MIDLTINKDLQRIPLGYFNNTVDRVFLEYLDLEKSHSDLITRKQKIDLGSKENMIISKRMAIDSAIARKKKASEDKLVILNGFIGVTASMCESRIKEILYITKTHPELIADEAEEKLLISERDGIFDYLAKIEQIKGCLPAYENKEEDGNEPNA